MTSRNTGRTRREMLAHLGVGAAALPFVGNLPGWPVARLVAKSPANNDWW